MIWRSKGFDIIIFSRMVSVFKLAKKVSKTCCVASKGSLQLAVHELSLLLCDTVARYIQPPLVWAYVPLAQLCFEPTTVTTFTSCFAVNVCLNSVWQFGFRKHFLPRTIQQYRQEFFYLFFVVKLESYF